MGLACLTASALILSYSDVTSLKNLSPVIGLASQPFWYYTAVKHNLPGVLVTNFIFTFAYAYGLYKVIA